MRLTHYTTALFAAGLVLGCGGGSGSSSPVTGPSTPATSTTPSTTISGAAVKGPVANANVSIKNAATGAVLATTTTGPTGSYSVDVPFSGDVIVEVSGGSYTDEATGAATPLSAPLKVVLNASGSTVTGIVTPLTTMAYTSAFGAGAAVNSAAFNASATKLATQFQLNGVNLSSTLPTVTGEANTYGKALKAISKYLQQQNVSLQALINTTMTPAQLASFSSGYSAAYNAANPGSAITFNFDNSGVTVGGTGQGGGTGSCGVNVKGNVTTQGFTVPVNFDYCVTGIAAGSCDSGNSSLSQAVAGQGGIAGGVNLAYTYSNTCAPGALAIRLQ